MRACTVVVPTARWGPAGRRVPARWYDTDDVHSWPLKVSNTASLQYRACGLAPLTWAMEAGATDPS
jgi:hypothetical protein